MGEILSKKKDELFDLIRSGEFSKEDFLDLLDQIELDLLVLLSAIEAEESGEVFH